MGCGKRLSGCLTSEAAVRSVPYTLRRYRTVPYRTVPVAFFGVKVNTLEKPALLYDKDEIVKRGNPWLKIRLVQYTSTLLYSNYLYSNATYIVRCGGYGFLNTVALPI